MLPESKHKADMGKVEDVLLTLQGENGGGVEIDHPELVGRTISALRFYGVGSKSDWE